MQVGRLEIKLVNSSTSFHGHSLVVCGHVQIGGEGGGGLLQSTNIKIFFYFMVVGIRNPMFAHPSTHVWGHETNNGAIVVA